MEMKAGFRTCEYNGIYQRHSLDYEASLIYSEVSRQDFPGSTVVKNPPANAGDTGLSPGLGRSHMSQSH